LPYFLVLAATAECTPKYAADVGSQRSGQPVKDVNRSPALFCISEVLQIGMFGLCRTTTSMRRRPTSSTQICLSFVRHSRCIRTYHSLSRHFSLSILSCPALCPWLPHIVLESFCTVLRHSVLSSGLPAAFSIPLLNQHVTTNDD
jgi:hypothetical protein